MERLTFTEMKQEIIEKLEKVESYKGMHLLRCSVNSLIEIEQKQKKGIFGEARGIKNEQKETYISPLLKMQIWTNKHLLYYHNIGMEKRV